MINNEQRLQQLRKLIREACIINTITENYMISTSLTELAIGQPARIIGFQPGHRAYRHKLLSMGLTPKTAISVQRVAPLGDPMQILVRGYALTLRRQEANMLIIEPIEPS